MKLLPPALLATFVFSVCALAENAALQLENPGFEDGLENWNVRRGNLSAAPEAAHDGQAGLRIDATENATITTLPVPLDGGKRYRLQLWIRGVENSHASVMISFSDGSRKAMQIENENDYKKGLPSGKEWKLFALEFTAPEAALFLNLTLGVWPKKDASAGDTIDIDEIRVEEFSATP